MKITSSKILLLAAAAVAPTHAFHIQPIESMTMTRLQAVKQGGPFSSAIDVDRAKNCADNFGECSVEEMKMFKKELHRERIQNFAAGGTGIMPAEEAFQHQLMEEELDLQLSLLERETPDATLFPEVESPMEELPHLKDGTSSAKAKAIVEESKGFAVVEELIEDGMMESLAICAMIGVLLLAPQFM